MKKVVSMSLAYDDISQFLNQFNEVRDIAYPQQDAFVMDMSRQVCAQTTVRAGKTTGIAIKHFRACQKYRRVMTPYIALTRDSAKNIMWPILQEVAERHKVQCNFTDSDLTCEILETGSTIKLFGADMKNFIGRIRGIKTPLASVDEGQEFRSHIEELVENILIARTSEYADGQVVLAGTPGPIPNGYFYEASRGLHGFSTHHWSLFDNPYFSTARSFVEDLKRKKGWAEDNPTLLREYYGRWVLDTDSLFVRYDARTSHYDVLPNNRWNFLLGIDLGFNDADALAVLAWSPNTPNTYLVEEVLAEKQGLTELVKQINSLRAKYNFSKMVIDEGGLGKKLAEEMRRQHKIPVHPAEKSRKFETVAFLNDAMRLGVFKAKSTSRFADDAAKVQIDTDRSKPDKIVLKDNFHSDIIDAVIYAFKESPAFSYVKPVEKPKYGTKEWASNEVTEMERMAEEHFKNIEQLEKGEYF